MKIIVVSAVNLITGGTLSILQQCLKELAEGDYQKDYRIIAIVHHKELCYYPNIEYIELSWPKTSWIKRIWCEYITFKRISQEIGPVYLWLSLHDTTPNVRATHQAVYCHNAFPLFKYTWRDFLFYKPIFLFVHLTNLFYRINIHRNRYVIVQQELMRQTFIRRFNLKEEEIIVAPPHQAKPVYQEQMTVKEPLFTFVYASAAGIQKNFETVCQAAFELEKEMGQGKFQVIFTIQGKENRYTQWLFKKWGTVSSLKFKGWMKKEELFQLYHASDSLIFASRIESWGLPISEYMQTGKPMIIAREPYARETSAGSACTTYFNTTSVSELKERMKECIQQNLASFHSIPPAEQKMPWASNWNEVFALLVKE